MSATIERNYRKNPHTANFLMTFHAAAKGLPADIARDEDLLDEVPVHAPAYLPSERQRQFITDLMNNIIDIDPAIGDQAVTYTVNMYNHNAWTRENVRTWIDHLIAKRDELRATAKAVSQQAPAAEVADGRYAVEECGALKFFKVKNGRRPGFVFLDIQASDEWHAVRNVTRIREILALIAVDAKAAMIRYGQEIGECGHCGRTLTDEASRAAGIGPICINK